MIDPEKALALIEPFEGTIPWMYLDTQGYVTVGVGNLLATPQIAIALVWNWRDPERRKVDEPDEIHVADEWTRVHGSLKGLTASAYRPITTMELHPYEIRRLFNRRVGDFEVSLQRAFPLFVTWPEPVQLATLDMAWNLGAGALSVRWPNLRAALERQDWAAAAAHSHRPRSRPERNEKIRSLYLEAAG